MMYSKGKKYDMEIRALVLDNLALATRMYKKTGKVFWKEQMVDLAAQSKALSERIKNHDYKKEDEEYAIVDDIDRRWQKVAKEFGV